MELKEKGSVANVEAFNQLMVTLAWQGKKDFDLGACLEFKDGSSPVMIYFDNRGDLNGPLFIQLDKDAGVGDTVDEGGNKETMKIMNLDQYSKIHILSWDYGAIQKNTPGRFKDDQISLQIMDDKGNIHEATLDSNDISTSCCIATIDNTSPMGAKFINSSIIGTQKNFAAEMPNFCEYVISESAKM